ncbi:MAG TPA: DCC1-like thiol-disulfide oxidoreductase family protein [Methylomirabilota bacterium]|nr:DCC1-like thiol-disulfide oxidoreductase family protein [Methylomirabilota bacterium]
MSNGWTGGQYSVVRAIFGAYLCVHLLHLVPWGAEIFSREGLLPDSSLSPLTRLFPNVLALWDTPVGVTALLLAGAALSVLFAIGWWDRAAAFGLWYIWACLFGRNPLISNPGLPFVGWLLLAHACVPSAPYGSVAAAGRVDPGGGWRMPPAIFGAAWIVMALGYSYSGYTKLVSPSWVDGTAVRYVLENPLARPTPLRDALLALPDWALRLQTWGALSLELLVAPLALIRRFRPWLWLALTGMHFGLMALIDFADLSLGMLMLHLFTLDPAWISPRASAPERLFYDGSCGLCHRAVRFVLAEDRTGTAFRVAPLGGDAFEREVPAGARAGLPDSLLIVRADGTRLVRSTAVLYVAERMGGLWRVLALVARVVPARLRDLAYDGVARVRHRLFTRPTAACPVLPVALRARFDG